MIRVGQIRIRIIIRIIRYGIYAVLSSLPPPNPNSVIPYIRRILAVLGNSKPQPFWSWLEPVIVKEVTDGVEGLVCKLKCMKGGGGCGKLLGIVNPLRSAKEHATEQGCRGHTYIG
jgi:hypothetical protein